MTVAQVPPDWLVPDWPAPTQVRALCTTREGGVSVGPWASFNLGRYTGDDPAAVGANWDTLQAVLSAAGPLVRPVYLKQIHGTALQPLVVDTPDGIEADACTTVQTGVACVAMAADCLPVLFTNREGTRVAAAHAGWRGLAAGVLESALEAFRPPALAEQAQKAINSEAWSQQVMAWLGPCIGPEAFEVGPEVRQAFCTCDPAAAQHFQAQAGGKYLADLAGLARQRLRAAGVVQLFGNDSSPAWCTVGNPSRFFSYRRDNARWGASGRMAACVWLAG